MDTTNISVSTIIVTVMVQAILLNCKEVGTLLMLQTFRFRALCQAFAEFPSYRHRPQYGRHQNYIPLALCLSLLRPLPRWHQRFVYLGYLSLLEDRSR